MMYFWLIPVIVLLLVLLWGLYVAATKRAPGRSEGRTISDHGRDPGGAADQPRST